MDKHLIKFNGKHRAEGETILASAPGYTGKALGRGKNKKRTGVLIATDTRVVFYRKGFWGEIIESIPIKSISSIERSSILKLRTIRIHTSNDDLTFTTAIPERETKLVNAIESQRHPSGASPAPTTNENGSPLDQLKKLGELRDAKVISDKEFETTKERILAAE